MIRTITVLIAIAAMGSLAQAGLGGTAASVDRDTIKVKAARKTVAQKSQYSVHTMDVSGTTVNEYVSTDGTVFAVSWQGVSKPDLSVIFGDHYQEYLDAKAQTRKKFGRQPLTIQTPGLVVRHAGHMRDLRGLAYIPSLVPAGVNPEHL